MAWVAPVVMGISAVMGAAGSAQQGEAAQANAAFDANRAEYEARLSEQDAQIAYESGADEDTAFRKKARAAQGTSIVNVARSGVTLHGSPLLVMSETAQEIEQESYGIRRGAAISANRAYATASGLRAYGSIRQQQGSSAYASGLWGAGSTLMQGASKIYRMRQTG